MIAHEVCPCAKGRVRVSGEEIDDLRVSRRQVALEDIEHKTRVLCVQNPLLLSSKEGKVGIQVSVKAKDSEGGQKR